MIDLSLEGDRTILARVARAYLGSLERDGGSDMSAVIHESAAEREAEDAEREAEEEAEQEKIDAERQQAEQEAADSHRAARWRTRNLRRPGTPLWRRA